MNKQGRWRITTITTAHCVYHLSRVAVLVQVLSTYSHLSLWAILGLRPPPTFRSHFLCRVSSPWQISSHQLTFAPSWALLVPPLRHQRLRMAVIRKACLGLLHHPRLISSRSTAPFHHLAGHLWEVKLVVVTKVRHQKQKVAKT